MLLGCACHSNYKRDKCERTNVSVNMYDSNKNNNKQHKMNVPNTRDTLEERECQRIARFIVVCDIRVEIVNAN